MKERWHLKKNEGSGQKAASGRLLSVVGKKGTATEERLQKIISASGLCSRRAAEELIRSGCVRVNGNTAKLGESADARTDVIEVNGKKLPKKTAFRYLMLNKPRGYVTTMSDEKGRPSVAELVADCGIRVYPVGRLDFNSEGLLLFTNDGDFANAVMHPSHEIRKKYIVWVSLADEEKIRRLGEITEIEGIRISPAEVELRWVKDSVGCFTITIHEGKNRQIRRMCDRVELKVTRLKRISEGPVLLGTLKPGTWRDLTQEETDGLRNACQR